MSILLFRFLTIQSYWLHLQLEAEYNKDREDMCDENGSFYEEYQDRFNDIYDDIEDRLLNNAFK